jgi:hypothetical protein
VRVEHEDLVALHAVVYKEVFIPPNKFVGNDKSDNLVSNIEPDTIPLRIL